MLFLRASGLHTSSSRPNSWYSDFPGQAASGHARTKPRGIGLLLRGMLVAACKSESGTQKADRLQCAVTHANISAAAVCVQCDDLR